MAFNCADTRQRAYNRIDTSNPSGNWIDEKQFNKARVGSCHKILVGNWEEEQVLEGNMLDKGRDISTLRKTGKYFKGGFESTPYLLTNTEPEERKFDANTTNRASYNDGNADINKQKKAALGARSRVKADAVIDIAKQELSESQSRLQSLGTVTKEEAFSSTYRDTLGGDKNPRKAVQSVNTSYMNDTPITVYGKNPVTGKQMVVPGKSLDNGTQNPHGRNAQFSYDKFSL